MRMLVIRGLLALVAALAGVVVLAPTPAFACSCVGGTTSAHADWADVVLLGTVTHREPPPQRAMMSSGDPATYTLEVEQVFKGESAATTQVLSAVSGASCGLENIEIGEEYVVFASPSRGELWANLCGGTRLASPSFLAELEQVTGPGSAPSDDSGDVAPPFSADQLVGSSWLGFRFLEWGLRALLHIVR